MITFSSLRVAMPDIDPEGVAHWIGDVAATYGRRVGNVAYLFADDEEILRTNRQFLGHDYYTDIITFDDDSGYTVNGDIIISLDTVSDNARLLGVPYRQELHRVIIHGILHLCGIDDKGPGQREIMQLAEDKALRLLADFT